LTLNTGAKMPLLGLGTWQGMAAWNGSEQSEVMKAIEVAIDAGYRHFDCASIYGNEIELGIAFKSAIDAGKVKREDLFIVSKLWNTNHDHVEEAVKKTLEDLQLDYLDLYLLHWPVAFEFQGIPPKQGVPKDENGNIKFGKTTIEQVWKDLEKLVEKKIC